MVKDPTKRVATQNRKGKKITTKFTTETTQQQQQQQQQQHKSCICQIMFMHDLTYGDM